MNTTNYNSSTLLPPRLIQLDPSVSESIECSVHTLPKPLLREFRHVFGSLHENDLADMQQQPQLLAIPTNQRAREDLVGVGDHVEQEKDRLLNVVGEKMYSARGNVD